MCFIIYKSANTPVPEYASIFKHPPSFLCFIFTYSYRVTRFFTDEISLTVSYKMDIVKCVHFESVRLFIQTIHKVKPLLTGRECTLHELK